jgi:D-tyrosyl-tRNA(Tyr) deacylase
MKAVLQRVNSCSIIAKDKIVSTIDKGILLFVGIDNNDKYKDADKLVEKITKIGIFEDDNGKISRNIREEKGEIMIVSQITLIANDCFSDNTYCKFKEGKET